MNMKNLINSLKSNLRKYLVLAVSLIKKQPKRILPTFSFEYSVMWREMGIEREKKLFTLNKETLETFKNSIFLEENWKSYSKIISEDDEFIFFKVLNKYYLLELIGFDENSIKINYSISEVDYSLNKITLKKESLGNHVERFIFSSIETNDRYIEYLETNDKPLTFRFTDFSINFLITKL